MDAIVDHAPYIFPMLLKRRYSCIPHWRIEIFLFKLFVYERAMVWKKIGRPHRSMHGG